ncbi:MAG: transporter substrate-binding domain-containing protein [Odoribacter sp.]|nr:transporter substrate-binding domain-containing protein [Odoribacter sp.]
MILPEPSYLEKILTRGTLNISTFYNTTDFYIYQGISRGFHYDLAKDFADYLMVNLQIIEINNNPDTAIHHLQNEKYDLLAISMTSTPDREEKLRFCHPFFKTNEVLVQNKNHSPIGNLKNLDGKEIFIPKNFPAYKKTLEQLEDSLNIKIHIREVDQIFNEDLLHLVETGVIHYTVVDENIARASSFSMKNLDFTTKLKNDISVSWVSNKKADLLTDEINRWLQKIRQEGKLQYLYKRYFNNSKTTIGNKSKYILLREGKISPYDELLKKESKRLGWDWRLLAAIVFSESQFNPEAESQFGAYGLMQIIPETAEHFHVFDYFRPDSNIHAGVSYLKYLDKYLTSYIADPQERIKFVLASYNAGPGHILDAIRLTKKYGKNPYLWENNVDFYMRHKNEKQYYQDSLAKNGYCNGPQTYHYVRRVLDIYNNYKSIKE